MGLRGRLGVEGCWQVKQLGDSTEHCWQRRSRNQHASPGVAGSVGSVIRAGAGGAELADSGARGRVGVPGAGQAHDARAQAGVDSHAVVGAGAGAGGQPMQEGRRQEQVAGTNRRGRRSGQTEYTPTQSTRRISGQSLTLRSASSLTSCTWRSARDSRSQPRKECS